MTKTSIFGQSEVKQEEKKPIEFVKSQPRGKYEWMKTHSIPTDWLNITLLRKNYQTGFDLMWVYDNYPNKGCLFLGHWNDGIVK